MKSTEPIQITKLVTDVLDNIRVPYFVTGSLASSLYGRGRSTFDADLVTKLQIDDIEDFVDQANKDFFVDQMMVQDAVRRKSSFNLVHREAAFKIDIFVAKDRDFDRGQFNRRIEKKFEDIPGSMYFASPEDTVLSKLEWFRLGNEVSERQWTDIIDVLKTQSNSLDRQLLNAWARKLSLSDLLSKAMKEAGY